MCMYMFPQNSKKKKEEIYFILYVTAARRDIRKIEVSEYEGMAHVLGPPHTS